MTRKRILEIEDGMKDWGHTIAIKIDRNYLTIINIERTHPLLEGDVGSFTLFDIEELDKNIPSVTWVKIGVILKIERLRDIIHLTSYSGLEFENEEQVKVYRDFVSRKIRSKYVI